MALNAVANAPGSAAPERRQRLVGVVLSLLALVAAVFLLAANPHLLVALNSDRDGQALLDGGTLAPGSSTSGTLLLANEGLLPLTYSLTVKAGQEELDSNVVIRLRRNHQANYFYQAALTGRTIPIGSLLPGQHDEIEVTLSAPKSASTASIPIDDTFVWNGHSPGIAYWWWLLAIAVLLAAAAFLFPRLLAAWAWVRRQAPLPFELYWRAPLILAIVLAASLIPLTGVSLSTVNAQTSNPGNVFAVGALVLSDRTPNGTTCLSVIGASAAAGPGRCDAVFQIQGATNGGRGGAHVTIRNVGTVPITRFQIWANGCTTVDDPAEGAHGTGELCGLVHLTMHDDNHDRCYFPVAQPGVCPVATNPASSLSSFAAQFTPDHRLALNPDGLGAGVTYGYTVWIDPAFKNDVQGRATVINLIWEVGQL